MGLRRPGWWPEALWPGEARRSRSSSRERLPARSPGTESSEEVVATFLRTLLESLGAGRVVLWRLDRGAGEWVPGEERAGEGWRSVAGERIRAAGHPFTWCLREGILLQTAREELLGRAAARGWSLVGAVPGGEIVLCIDFSGSPSPGARAALRAALDHLSALRTI